MFRTANPAFNTNTFAHFREALGSEARASQNVMTVQGTVNKIGFLLVLCAGAAAFTWTSVYQGLPIGALLVGGIVGASIFALITIFKKEWAKVTAPLYAIFEGLLLGGLSAFVDQFAPGVPLVAVALTFGVLGVMVFLYVTRIIQATPRFVAGVIAATGAICLVYLTTWVLGMFGLHIPFIHGSGWIGIGFSLAVVVIAALNLVLDFHMIEEGAEEQLPKEVEWYAAFGLMVTLVWLYIEILHLALRLMNRD